MLGLSDTEPATSELALRLVHPEDRPRLAEMLDVVASERMPPHFEATLRVYRADTGALRWIKSVGWSSFSDSGKPLREIGRASCRARMCQSVLISVVGVALKKNTTTNITT